MMTARGPSVSVRPCASRQTPLFFTDLGTELDIDGLLDPGTLQINEFSLEAAIVQFYVQGCL
jgi:hypothetical protein